MSITDIITIKISKKNDKKWQYSEFPFLCVLRTNLTLIIQKQKISISIFIKKLSKENMYSLRAFLNNSLKDAL